MFFISLKIGTIFPDKQKIQHRFESGIRQRTNLWKIDPNKNKRSQGIYKIENCATN